MPKPTVNHSRDWPRAQPTMSLALLDQVGGMPGLPGAWVGSCGSIGAAIGANMVFGRAGKLSRRTVLALSWFGAAALAVMYVPIDEVGQGQRIGLRHQPPWV